MARRLATASLALLQLSMDFPGVPPIAFGFHATTERLTTNAGGQLVAVRNHHDTQTGTKKQVRVYIESGCPDSQLFCLGSLARALDPHQGLTPLINVSLIAWGNAYHKGVAECKHIKSGQYNRAGSHCWQNACKNGTLAGHCFNESAMSVHQHGQKEGEVDRLVNCAMRYAGSPWPYVRCLLSRYDHVGTSAALAAECKANATDSAEREKIRTAETCALSDEGKTLLMQAAASTPKHPGVPYVTIDGESVDSDKFLEELCERLDATEVPPACASASPASPGTSSSAASAVHMTSAKEAKAAPFEDGGGTPRVPRNMRKWKRRKHGDKPHSMN
jgi:hypothetical protein